MATKATTLWALATVRSWLGAGSDTADDTDIQRIADGVSEFIERYTRRKFVTQTVTEIQDSEARQNQIFLNWYPIDSVTSITVRWSPTDSTPETLSADTYRAFLKQGRVWVHSFRMPKTIGGITVVYVAGYAAQDNVALPQDIVAIGLELCKLIYTEHKNGAIGAQSLALGGQTFVIKPEWPKQIKDTLEQWRRPF